MAYYFVYFDLKRCKECATSMNKLLVPLEESLMYQIFSNSLTGISEGEEQVCLGSKKWTPNFALCRLPIWAEKCFFCVCQRSLGCPWTAAQRRIWPLLLHTWSCDRFAKFGTFKHLHLLHPDSSTACWLELAFLPDWIYSIWIRWPFLLYLFALKTINHFKKELSWELSLYLSA